MEVYVFIFKEFHNWCFNHIPQRVEMSCWSGSPHRDSVTLWLKGEVAKVASFFFFSFNGFGLSDSHAEL